MIRLQMSQGSVVVKAKMAKAFLYTARAEMKIRSK